MTDDNNQNYSNNFQSLYSEEETNVGR